MNDQSTQRQIRFHSRPRMLGLGNNAKTMATIIKGLQNRNRLTDTENKLMATMGKGVWGGDG